MDKEIKKRWICFSIEVLIINALCILGLVFSPWFIIAAVFLWLGISIYRSYIAPGGPW